MRTANPALRSEMFVPDTAAVPARTMTVQGTVVKTAVLLGLCVATASLSWSKAYAGVAGSLAEGGTGVSAGYPAAGPWIFGGMIAGLVLAFVTIFKPAWSPFTAPLYALAEGLFLGGISALFEAAYPGLVVQAVLLTFGVTASILIMYMTRLIRATKKFRTGIMAATGGIFLVYLVSFVMSFFGGSVPFIHESGMIGIGFSVFVVAIASLNLVLDFDFIEQGSARGAPKYMEWYGAFGLMVTLVWLYLEILRLLAKLQSRD